MRVQLVAKNQIRINQVIEVLFAKDGKEIQALGSNRSYPSFYKCVLIRCLRSRGPDAAVDFREDLIKLWNIHAVTISNEMRIDKLASRACSTAASVTTSQFMYQAECENQG